MTRTELTHAQPGDSIILPFGEDEYVLTEVGEWAYGNWRRLSWAEGNGVRGMFVPANGPEILGKRLFPPEKQS
jgi:hypothetical protein